MTKIRTVFALLGVLAMSLAGRTLAADPAPPTAAPTNTIVSAPAAAPATNSALQQLQKLIGTVNNKLQSGAVKSEADLAGEMKQFDLLLAEHAQEKSDDVAQILFMKAMLYLQVFQEFARGKELLTQLKTDFPKTKFAAQADQVLAQVENILAQLENMKRMQEQARKLQESLGIVVGSKFPEFEGKDIAGQPISLAKYKGKVLLVDFWATWCGPCVAELPHVLAAYEKYHTNGFEIVGINRDQDENKLKEFIEEKKMSWQQYFDGDSKVADKYGISLIPAAFLLDGTGKLIARDLRGEELEKAVAAALAKK